MRTTTVETDRDRQAGGGEREIVAESGQIGGPGHLAPLAMSRKSDVENVTAGLFLLSGSPTQTGISSDERLSSRRQVQGRKVRLPAAAAGPFVPALSHMTMMMMTRLRNQQ